MTMFAVVRVDMEALRLLLLLAMIPAREGQSMTVFAVVWTLGGQRSIGVRGFQVVVVAYFGH